MAGSHYSFDVQTRHGSRWVTDSIKEREHPARTRAAELLADPNCTGARIIRSWGRPDGVEVETEIFSQTRDVKEDTTIRIAPADGVPRRCQTLRDFFGFDSRQAMARIFRHYLAKAFVTPTEIIYNMRQLKRVSEKDTLVRSAVDMVAALQTRDGGQDTKARRDEIYHAVGEMFERARTLDPASLPKLGRKLSDVMAAVPRVDREEHSYLILAALSRDLATLPSWAAKLELLCKLAEAEDDPDALDMVDGVVADVLGTDVIHDILGIQPNLGATICALLDLADGIAPSTRSSIGDITASLCHLLAAQRLPSARRCLVDRAHRAIRLPVPLRPNDQTQEPEDMGKIIARVLTPAGLHSGPDTAHALTTRFTRMVEPGGKTGRRAAIEGVFLAMPDLAYGVLYLCAAARTDFAKEHLDDMAALFDRALAAPTLAAFCHPSLTSNARMARATAAHHAVAASPYPPAITAQVMAHVDHLLERFVVEEKIIETLDQPDRHLRDRALRLVQFCGSGLLPKGKALRQAQQRTLALLKQSDFPNRFVAGIDDPVAAQSALRDFFTLLKSTGVYGG